MWISVHLECHVVWDDVLWRCTAIWQDEDGSEPVVLEKHGRCPSDPDGGPDAVLAAAASALKGQAYVGR